MLFLSPEGMREVDRRTIERGIPGQALMDAAGRAVAEETWRAFPDSAKRLVVLCGGGNNGGDGFVAARELSSRYSGVSVYLAGSLERLGGDARKAAERYVERVGRSAPALTELSDAGPLREALEHADSQSVVSPAHGPIDEASAREGGVLLLDALLGTGTKGEIRGLQRELLEVTARFRGPVIAVDAPSGLDMESGAALGPLPRAVFTVTFGAAKLGHVLGKGPEHAGRVLIRDIGLDVEALAEAGERADSARSLEAPEVERLLPLPPRTAHKRSTGVVAVIAGSRSYGGAVTLTCRGALRTGAGLVHALVVDELARPLTTSLPEVIATPLPSEHDGSLGPHAREHIPRGLEKARADVLAIGPGLGSAAGTFAMVRELVAHGDVRAILLDADGINAFVGERTALREAAARLTLAITPHPGELGRLYDLPARQVDARRLAIARQAAQELGCVVLLKGAPTVICAPGRPAILNLTGNPGLARGGTGDLLTGVAATLLAKRLPALEALALAAFVHGLAADLTRAERGTLSMTVGDIAEGLSAALRAVETGETEQALQTSAEHARFHSSPS
jgi:hydroxyethylthiazole kinase-like uncharacterized protein yjeF